MDSVGGVSRKEKGHLGEVLALDYVSLFRDPDEIEKSEGKKCP